MKNNKLEYGELPPMALDVEAVVLGAMILERDCFVNNPVKKEWFYKEEHQRVVECIADLSSESIPIDMIQVTKKLNNKGHLEAIGGPVFINKLCRRVASSANVDHHIRIIKQEYARREMIRIASEIARMSYDSALDVDDVFSFAQDEFSNVMSYDSEDSASTYEDATYELIEELKSGLTPGLKTGLSKFDSFTGGLHNSDLIIIGGETSQGKTSLAVSMLRYIIKNGTPAAVFSTEMTKKQLVARTSAQETGVSAKDILYNRLSEDRRDYILSELIRAKDYPVYFDDQSNNDIDKICTSIRKLKIKRNIGVVLVDFIQDLKGADTETGIADIGRKLKNVAKELDIPVIGISQLSRDKNNPKPNMSRLRGSGQLEEKADVIMLLWRPEFYNLSLPDPFSGTSAAGAAQVIIGKGRNVGLAQFLLNFNKNTTNFFDHGIPEEHENFKPLEPNTNFNHNEYEKQDQPF